MNTTDERPDEIDEEQQFAEAIGLLGEQSTEQDDNQGENDA